MERVSHPAIVGRKSVWQINLRIGPWGEIAATLHHAAHPVVYVAQAKRLPYRALHRAEQPSCQVVADDRRANAALQVCLRKGVALQEAESIDTEEGGVHHLYLRVEVAATVGGLDVSVVIQPPRGILGGDDLGVLEVQRPVLQSTVGQGRLPRLLVVLELHRLQIQRPPPVLLRIDGRQLHVVNHRHNHGHADGKPRADDVERAEQRILPQQRPRLFQILFQHS